MIFGAQLRVGFQQSEVRTNVHLLCIPYHLETTKIYLSLTFLVFCCCVFLYFLLLTRLIRRLMCGAWTLMGVAWQPAALTRRWRSWP